MKSGLNRKLHQVDVKKLYLEANIIGKETLNLCSISLSYSTHGNNQDKQKAQIKT